MSMEVENRGFKTRSWAQRTSLCHSTHLETYGQKESWQPQNNLAPHWGEREGNGGLEVLGESKNSG